MNVAFGVVGTPFAVLVECGFLSNPAEAQLLQNKEYQKKLAFAIVYGVAQYLEEGNHFEV